MSWIGSPGFASSRAGWHSTTTLADYCRGRSCLVSARGHAIRAIHAALAGKPWPRRHGTPAQHGPTPVNGHGTVILQARAPPTASPLPEDTAPVAAIRDRRRGGLPGRAPRSAGRPLERLPVFGDQFHVARVLVAQPVSRPVPAVRARGGHPGPPVGDRVFVRLKSLEPAPLHARVSHGHPSPGRPGPPPGQPVCLRPPPPARRPPPAQPPPSPAAPTPPSR